MYIYLAIGLLSLFFAGCGGGGGSNSGSSSSTPVSVAALADMVEGSVNVSVSASAVSVSGTITAAALHYSVDNKSTWSTQSLSLLGSAASGFFPTLSYAQDLVDDGTVYYKVVFTNDAQQQFESEVQSLVLWCNEASAQALIHAHLTTAEAGTVVSSVQEESSVNSYGPYDGYALFADGTKCVIEYSSAVVDNRSTVAYAALSSTWESQSAAVAVVCQKMSKSQLAEKLAAVHVSRKRGTAAAYESEALTVSYAIADWNQSVTAATIEYSNSVDGTYGNSLTLSKSSGEWQVSLPAFTYAADLQDTGEIWVRAKIDAGTEQTEEAAAIHYWCNEATADATILAASADFADITSGSAVSNGSLIASDTSTVSDIDFYAAHSGGKTFVLFYETTSDTDVSGKKTTLEAGTLYQVRVVQQLTKASLIESADDAWLAMIADALADNT